MNFTIDRSKWARGTNDAKLVASEDGKMCCLGFFYLACGVARASIIDLGEPHEPFDNDLDLPLPKLAAFLVEESEDDDEECWGAPGRSYACSDAGADLIYANDDLDLTEVERERRIAMLFAGQGVDVAFVDSAEPFTSATKETDRG